MTDAHTLADPDCRVYGIHADVRERILDLVAPALNPFTRFDPDMSPLSAIELLVEAYTELRDAALDAGGDITDTVINIEAERAD